MKWKILTTCLVIAVIGLSIYTHILSMNYNYVKRIVDNDLLEKVSKAENDRAQLWTAVIFLNRQISDLTKVKHKDAELAQTVITEPPVEPNYRNDIFYTLQVPVSVYPQVTEKDVSDEDWSVQISYNSIIATLPKGHQILIKECKFCNRTNSWWLEVEYRDPYAIGFASRESGWVNNNALIEYPLVVSEKR
ncbi:MAG: hypothetical protein WC476_12465 [Phycisphaerae bacterium]|jgi:hypothetical protein